MSGPKVDYAKLREQEMASLAEATTVVARPGSTTGGATLEIRVSNRKVYKIRY